MAEIKTKKRNRSSDEMLSSLINILMNAKDLSKKDAKKITLRWLNTKSCRYVGLAIQLEEPELHNSHDLCEIDLEKFFL